MDHRSRRAYQTAATAGVSLAELHAVVYSNLAQDFLKAAAAVRENDIAGRCSASNHALLLIGHLESWLEALDEPNLTLSLQQFYSMLRTRTLHLQGKPDRRSFEELAEFVLSNSAAWQTLSSRRQPMASDSALIKTEATSSVRLSFTA